MNKILQWFRSIFYPSPHPLPKFLYDDVLKQINTARESNGHKPLIGDDKLNTIAQGWANRLAASMTLSHGNFGSRIASAYPNVAAGEDIAEGQWTATEVVNAWMSDAPHRANILGNFNIVGIGFALGSDNNIYWVCDFAMD